MEPPKSINILEENAHWWIYLLLALSGKDLLKQDKKSDLKD